MQALDNLVKTNSLKKEPRDLNEFSGMLESARLQLTDSQNSSLSMQSRFTLAYGAAHSLSLAALRWFGYRSDNRYLVFQCLQHTLGLEPKKWRLLDLCHKKRDLAEYEGYTLRLSICRGVGYVRSPQSLSFSKLLGIHLLAAYLHFELLWLFVDIEPSLIEALVEVTLELLERVDNLRTS